MLVSNRVPIKTRSKNSKELFQYPIKFLSRPDPRNKRDYASIQQSQSIWQSEESPSKERKQELQKTPRKKIHKNKSKRNLVPQSQCPLKTPKTPRKKHLLSRHDATEAEKGHGPVLCYRGKKEIRLLTLYYSQFTEETSQEQAKKKGFQDSEFPGKTLVCRRERVKINRNCSRTFSFNDKNGFVC